MTAPPRLEPTRVILPPIALLIGVVVLPIVLLWMARLVGERMLVETPDALPFVDVLRGIAIFSLAYGLGLVMLVPVALAIGRTRPGILIWIIDSGARGGIPAVAVLVLLQTVVAVTIVLIAERLVFGRIFAGSVGPLALGGLASAFFVATSGASRFRSRTPSEPAVRLTANDAPGLEALVRDLATRMNVAAPAAMLVGSSMDFSIGPDPARPDDDRVTALRISLPAMALLRTEDVAAIVAHELAHVRNGDVDTSRRLQAAFRRLGQATEALDSESRDVVRIAGVPGLVWLRYVARSTAELVVESRRSSETAADRVAAEIVGPQAIADALVALATVEPYARDWTERSNAEPDGRVALSDLVDAVQSGVAETDAETGSGDEPEAGQAWALAPITHPSLADRIAGLGVPASRYNAPPSSALQELVGDEAVILTQQVVQARRLPSGLSETSPINPPRVTPGLIVWAVFGLIAITTLTSSVLTLDHGVAETLQTLIVLGAIWIVALPTYMWLQREVRVDDAGMDVRPWLLALPFARGRDRWTRIPYGDAFAIEFGLEHIVRISDGSASIRCWTEIWPRRETRRLIGAARERNGAVRFSRNASELDDERQAVLWVIGHDVLAVTVRRSQDGRLIEVPPVKRVGGSLPEVATALSRQLNKPVKGADTRKSPLVPADLAGLVDLTPEEFAENARRIEIGGFPGQWAMRIDGEDEIRFDGDELQPSLVALIVVRRLIPEVDRPESKDENEDGDPG